jgi:arylsulfatase A-like enzyme
MRWPDRIKPGTVYSEPISLLDVLPTSAAAVGSKLPMDRSYDGVDFLPYLTGQKSGEPHNELFWRRELLISIRKGGFCGNPVTRQASTVPISSCST